MEAKVDATKRQATSANHSAVHLMHAAAPQEFSAATPCKRTGRGQRAPALRFFPFPKSDGRRNQILELKPW
ncbi:MAG: hypothetical protein IPM82_18015 [Saprospiraceae bacterium]|nr:hypothetical protein [Saprospiraceae bacterium]